MITNLSFSTGTFQLQYTPVAQQVMFDQVFNNTISGFVPNTNDADPNFGKCLQCAAIDRTRYKLSPTVNPPTLNRSSFCQTCFTQYCFNQENPPSQSEVPNRQQVFVDPDPEGLVDFLEDNKFKLVGGVVGLVVFIVLLVGGLCVLFLCSKSFCGLTSRDLDSGGNAAETGGSKLNINKSVRCMQRKRSL